MKSKLLSWRVGLAAHPFLLLPPLFYLYTCAPSIGLGDTGIMLDAMMNGNLSSHVNNHPLTVLVGWLFLNALPFEDVAFRGNLVSVLFGTLTVWIFYAALVSTFRNRLTAVIGAAMMMFCQSLWWHSTLVENYAATAMFTAAFLYLQAKIQLDYRPRHLMALFGIMGLAVFNHVQMGFLCIGAATTFVLIFAKELRHKGLAEAQKLFLGCLATGIVSFVPWATLVVRDSMRLGSLTLGLKEAFFGSFQHIMLKGDFVFGVKDLGVLAFIQFPHLGLLAVVAGPYFLYRSWKLSPAVVGTLVFFGLNTWFFMFYNTWDKYAFLMPTWVIACFAATFAIDRALKSELFSSRPQMRKVALVLAGLNLAWAWFFFDHIAGWGTDRDSIWHSRYNNDYTYHLYRVNEYVVNPDKRHYRDVDSYIRILFDKLPKDAIYVDDDARAYYPVEFYYRHYGMRPDLTLQIFNSWDIPNWGVTQAQLHAQLDDLLDDTSRRIFFVSTDAPFSKVLDGYRRRSDLKIERFDLDEQRWVYELRAKTASGQRPPAVVLDASQKPIDIKVHHLGKREGIAFLTEQTMRAFGTEWGDDDQVFVKAESEGGYLEIPFRIEGSFQGKLEVAMTKAPDFGRASVGLDYAAVLAEADCFDERVSRQVFETGDLSIAPGEHRLRFDIKPGRKGGESLSFGFDSVRLVGTVQKADSVVGEPAGK